MKIWIINPYGPVPSESWRDYSYVMLGRQLAEAGHEVVWWTSNFSHHFKQFRSKGWEDIADRVGFTIRLVPTTGYKRNIGLGRIIRDWVFAIRAFRNCRNFPPPDAIVFSESPLTFGYAGQKMAETLQCPSIYHQMDLWPELIINAFPARLQKIANVLFAPVYSSRRRVFSKLNAVTALALPYLEAVFREEPRLREHPHAVVYNGIDVAAFRRHMTTNTQPIPGLPEKQPGDIWAIFAGSLGPSYDIPTLWKVAERLAASNSSIHIIVAGDGPYRPMLEQRSDQKSTTRLHYVGKLAPQQLAGLYRSCDIGLCAYSAGSNVEMPDKIYDYTAAGLAVINSLSGEVSNVIAQNQIGLQYLPGHVEDLLAKLLKLTASPAEMKAMAERSRLLGETYDRHVQYAQLVRVVQSVVKQGIEVPVIGNR